VNQATQLKLDGLERSASHHAVDLRKAQLIAELMAGMGRIITADDVRELFEVQHGRPLQIGNAMGSIFASKKKWQCVGRVRSKRPDSHARWVSQWQLKQAYRPAPQPFEVGVENGVRFCLTCNQETEACTCSK
jgi:hypothetical protein